MANMKIGIFTALFFVAGIASAVTSSRGKALILVDNLDAKTSHSKFLKTIESLGFETSLSLISNEDLKLKELDTWIYDAVVILGGSTKFGYMGKVNKASLVEYFNAGHNLFIVLDPDATAAARSLASELGVSVESVNSRVIDHFHVSTKLDAQKQHTAIMATVKEAVSTVLREDLVGKEIAFSGVGLSLSPESTLAMGILSGHPSTYSGEPGKRTQGSRTLGGSALKLAACVQGRNNARACVLGSLDMVSDEYFAATKTNAQFAEDMLAWTLKLKSVLKASQIRHRIIEGEVSPASYRVKDDVEVAVDIEECNVSGCSPYMYVVYEKIEALVRTLNSYTMHSMYLQGK